jgi:trimeric autotransporter adhesin
VGPWFLSHKPQNNLEHQKSIPDLFGGLMKNSRVLLGFRWVALAGFVLSLPGLAWAQPLDTPLSQFWRVNGIVYDIAVTSNTAYLGGTFTYAGPASGCTGVADLTTGTAQADFPVLNGQVNCVVSDGQGGWFIGGQFVEASSGLINLIQVRANRTVNQAWAPNPDGAVRALARGLNNLYVGGDFYRIAGQDRYYLVALNPVTGQTNNWNVRCNNSVYAMTMSGGTLYLGGWFTTINNQSRGRLAAVDAATAELKAWDPAASGGSSVVYTLSVDGSLVYVGGDFTICGTKPRNRVAAVDATTGVANNWNPNASHTSGSAAVYAIIAKENAIYVGGYFSAIGGRNRNYLAALNKTTGLADVAWDPNPNGYVAALWANGTDLLVGGQFTQIAAKDRLGIAALEAASGTVKPWQVSSSSLRPGVAPTVRALAVDGAWVACGGDFTSFGGLLRNRLLALDLSTGRATSWNPAPDYEVYALCLGTNELFVGGAFTNIAGTNIARLAAVTLTDGSALSWNPQVTGYYVLAMAWRGDTIFAGGQFTKMGGETRYNFAEVNLADGKATSWDPSPQGAIRQLLVYQDRLYIAGEYYSIQGLYRSYLTAYALADKTLISGFDPKPDAPVRALAIQEGRLYVGGDFTQIGNQTRSRLAVISPDTGLETDVWSPEVGVTGSLRVWCLVPTANVIYAGGTFGAVGGEFRKNIAGVTVLMASATSWNPAPNGNVRKVVIANNLVFIGGEFTTLGTDSWPYFAVFSGKPSILPGSLKVKGDGKVELQVLDGDGHGSNVLLQAADSLKNPSWQTLLNQEVFGTATLFEDAQASGKAQRFYRALVEP